MSSQELICKYIKVRYKTNGRNYTQGLDCWGLVMCIIYDLFNVTLPDANYQLRKIIDTNHQIFNDYKIEDWVERVPILKYGDIILFASINNLPIHVGVYVERNKFIHCTMPGGVKVEEITPYKPKIKGFYRIRCAND